MYKPVVVVLGCAERIPFQEQMEQVMAPFVYGPDSPECTSRCGAGGRLVSLNSSACANSDARADTCIDALDDDAWLPLSRERFTDTAGHEGHVPG